MSFHEKSLWLLFISLIAVFGSYYYFALLVEPGGNGRAVPVNAALIVGLIVILVIVQVLGSALLALAGKLAGTTDGPQGLDERDRMHELLGARNGSFVLAAGIFFALCAALLTSGDSLFVHLLLGSWVLAQLVDTGTQIFLNRRSA